MRIMKKRLRSISRSKSRTRSRSRSKKSHISRALYLRLLKSRKKRKEIRRSIHGKRKRLVVTSKTMSPAATSDFDPKVAYKQGYDEAYSQGFNSGFAQGFEDGNKLSYKSQ